LRPAAGKPRAGDAEPFFTALQDDLVPHAPILLLATVSIRGPNGPAFRAESDERSERTGRMRVPRVRWNAMSEASITLSHQPAAAETGEPLPVRGMRRRSR
jgi:hypothetical protein